MSRQPPSDICQCAKNSQTKWKVPASVQLGQWILESGWGEHSPNNNPFGMKPRAGKNDPFETLMTTEVIKGKAVRIPQNFRKFESIQDAFDAHAELLATAPVYAPAMKALPDINKFIDLMGVKYATDPNYATKLKSLIKSQSLNVYNT